jgi:hypothetical protein
VDEDRAELRRAAADLADAPVELRVEGEHGPGAAGAGAAGGGPQRCGQDA